MHTGRWDARRSLGCTPVIVQVISTCDAHGGDVCRFAGDSLIVAFWAEGTSIADATLSAARCAWALGQQLGTLSSVCHRHRCQP